MLNLIAPVGADVVRSAFNFDVNKFPLSGPDGMHTPKYGLFRSDNSEFVGEPVSKKYVVHTTEDVVTLTEAALAAFDGSAIVKAYWSAGHHVIIEPTKDHRRSIYGTRDNIFPRFMVSAGYDGRPFNGSLGMYRDACQNMAIMRSVSGTTVSIRHTGGLRSRMDELIGVFEGLRAGWKTLGDVVAELESRTVSLAEFLQVMYPLEQDASKTAVTHNRQTIEAIFRRVQNERFSTGRPRMNSSFDVSRWEAYNAIQGYVQHVKSGRGQKSEFGRILYAADSPVVKRAEAYLLS